MKLDLAIRLSICAGITVISGLSYWYCHSDARYFRDVFTAEDGAIEWATVVVLLLLFFASLRHALRGPLSWVWGLSGISFAIGAGEEITWGQRIFNILTPDFFYHHNIQHEINVHNLQLPGRIEAHTLIEQILLSIIIGYFFLIPTLEIIFDKSIFKHWSLPRPNWDGIYLVSLMLVVGAIIPCYRKREVMELGLCCAILVLIWPIRSVKTD